MKGEPHLLSAPDGAPGKESSQGAEASRPKSRTEALSCFVLADPRFEHFVLEYLLKVLDP